MSKHTPGPWQVGDELEGLWVYTDPNQNVICDVVGRNDPHIMTDEDYANAHLIAAAPEMLDALSVARVALKLRIKKDATDGELSALLLIEDVISKAKGNT
jgi:hypothetical protein